MIKCTIKFTHGGLCECKFSCHLIDDGYRSMAEHLREQFSLFLKKFAKLSSKVTIYLEVLPSVSKSSFCSCP